MTRTPALAALAFAIAAGPAVADPCSLVKVAMVPLTVENGPTYHGRAGDVELTVRNFVTKGPVKLFPEPPLTVRRDEAESSCDIGDGGAWSRDGVWLAADGRTLITLESSGASQSLVFRDTRTCARAGTLAIAGQAWRIEDHALLLQAHKAPKADTRVVLDDVCRPRFASDSTP